MNLTVNAKETALVLIDLEQGIVARDLAPHSAKDVVARCAKLSEALRKAGGTVIYVHVLLDEIAQGAADKPMQRPSTPLPPAASELVPEAGFQPGDVLITKRGRDASHATNLDQALRRRGIKTVILSGIATNFGVESTARSAQEYGYELIFAEDAMSSMSAEMHEFSTTKMFPTMGRVRQSAEIISALGN